MYQIKPHVIWIGHAGDGTAYQDIFNTGIKILVQLAIEEPPIQPPRELLYLRFPLFDGEGNDPEILQLVIATIARLIALNVPTLVFCGAGMSRSPAITAAAFAFATGTDLENSLKMVVRNHPADVSPSLFAEIKATLRTMN